MLDKLRWANEVEKRIYELGCASLARGQERWTKCCAKDAKRY